jgi:hypothetical protein
MGLKWKRKNSSGFTASTCGRYWFGETHHSGTHKGKRLVFGLKKDGFHRVFIGDFRTARSCKLHAGIYHEGAVAGSLVATRGLPF